MKHIKHINEFFDAGTFGDTYGYGGANGIFKIQYKPYKDLGTSVGPDPNVKRTNSGSQYQIGDIVIGEPMDSDKKVAGMIVRRAKNTDGKSYKYFVQVSSKKADKEEVIELKANSIEFVDKGDKGHQEIISQFKFNELPGGVYNSPTVYNNTSLGQEGVGS